MQKMGPPGTSCVFALLDDPSFGSLLSFGLSGMATELLGDRAYRPLPLSTVDAAELIREPRAAPLLSGYRGEPPARLDALEDLALRLNRLAEDLPEVRSLVLDPVLAGPDGRRRVRVADRARAAADPRGSRARDVCSDHCGAGAPLPGAGSASEADLQRRRRGLREEVVALVVHHHERGEVLDLDLPDRLHAQLRVLQHLHRPDAVLREPGRRAADRAEVEPAVRRRTTW